MVHPGLPQYSFPAILPNQAQLPFPSDSGVAVQLAQSLGAAAQIAASALYLSARAHTLAGVSSDVMEGLAK